MTITTDLTNLRSEIEGHIEKIRYHERVLLQNREGFLKRIEALDVNLYEDTLKGHYGMTLSSIFVEFNKLEEKIKKI